MNTHRHTASALSPLARSATATLVALGLAAFALPQPAAADIHTSTRSMTLAYDASKLDSTAAARQLYARIEGAARRVCGQPDLRDLRAVRDAESCRSEAVASAVTSAASPQLLAVHRAATGQDESIRLAANNSRR